MATHELLRHISKIMRSPDDRTPKTATPDSSEKTNSYIDNRETSRPDPASKTPPALANDTTSHINPDSKAEPMTQVQTDSVLTREQLPDVRLRITLGAIALTTLLFVAALYYGIINP